MNHEFHRGDGGARQEIDDRPSLPVAELRGHGDGPIHIVRFTGERSELCLPCCAVVVGRANCIAQEYVCTERGGIWPEVDEPQLVMDIIIYGSPLLDLLRLTHSPLFFVVVVVVVVVVVFFGILVRCSPTTTTTTTMTTTTTTKSRRQVLHHGGERQDRPTLESHPRGSGVWPSRSRSRPPTSVVVVVVAVVVARPLVPGVPRRSTTDATRTPRTARQRRHCRPFFVARYPAVGAADANVRRRPRASRPLRVDESVLDGTALGVGQDPARDRSRHRPGHEEVVGTRGADRVRRVPRRRWRRQRRRCGRGRGGRRGGRGGGGDIRERVVRQHGPALGRAEQVAGAAHDTRRGGGRGHVRVGRSGDGGGTHRDVERRREGMCELPFVRRR